MLVTGGMLIENDKGNRYDRFRGRIMFQFVIVVVSNWLWWSSTW